MEVDYVGQKGKKKGKSSGKTKDNANKESKGKNQANSKGKVNKSGGKTAAAAGAGKGPSNRFEGYCGQCGKWGHKRETCWNNTANGQSGRTVVAAIDTEAEKNIKGLFKDATDNMEEDLATLPVASPRGGWLMGLFMDQGDKMVGNLEITEEGEYITEGVIDSGAAVTASPWSFGDHCDTVYPEHPPRLSAVDGQPLEYYGRRQVPCDIELQDGTIDMALLRPEVCNVS